VTGGQEMATMWSEEQLCRFTQNITAKAALCVDQMVGDMGTMI